MTLPWPWPADTQLDIARRLLQSYREQLKSVAPETCTLLDSQATEFGQGWVVPKIQTVDSDDLLTAIEAAELIGMTAQAIYQWAYRGYIPRREGPDGRTRYRAGDVLDHVETARRARAERRTGQPRD
ncbi:helix-turn-helix domain-containing protein [Rhodococcus sp. USK10]|uniref:helix-turn-helix transcriptional regulator n=1 Tax=Rhodococcus sp. USK10 TaxID=2789739 RepID=UPI001C5DDB01|nr:helix-turn-helix domain-containing protein [Rhodococcus sp. USK10]QYB01463.1 helix-turn-helix domain-containing protein [Rhodococcus sp. USK10]